MQAEPRHCFRSCQTPRLGEGRLRLPDHLSHLFRSQRFRSLGRSRTGTRSETRSIGSKDATGLGSIVNSSDVLYNQPRWIEHTNPLKESVRRIRISLSKGGLRFMTSPPTRRTARTVPTRRHPFNAPSAASRQAHEARAPGQCVLRPRRCAISRRSAERRPTACAHIGAVRSASWIYHRGVVGTSQFNSRGSPVTGVGGAADAVLCFPRALSVV